MKLRRLVRGALPISRVGMALWAWRNRDELARWGGFAVAAVGRVADGAGSDVLTEAKLRARLTSDSRTRGADGLHVLVEDGVATLSGRVDPAVRDAALAIATDISGVHRVRDVMAVSGRDGLLGSVRARS
jgi:hypothetical protein